MLKRCAFSSFLRALGSMHARKHALSTYKYIIVLNLRTGPNRNRRRREMLFVGFVQVSQWRGTVGAPPIGFSIFFLRKSPFPA